MNISFKTSVAWNRCLITLCIFWICLVVVKLLTKTQPFLFSTPGKIIASIQNAQEHLKMEPFLYHDAICLSGKKHKYNPSRNMKGTSLSLWLLTRRNLPRYLVIYVMACTCSAFIHKFGVHSWNKAICYCDWLYQFEVWTNLFELIN